jgi:phenylalanyl-tRNA synthetase alpha chain
MSLADMTLADFVAELDALEAAATSALAAAKDAAALEAARIEFTGAKAGRLKAAQQGLGKVDKAYKPAAGKRFNEAKQAVEAALAAAQDRVAAGGKAKAREAFDPTLPGRRVRLGHLHPVTQTIADMKDIMGRLGFTAVEGPEIEDEWHNFEALNIPPDHPARTMKDSIYVNIPGHPELLLRTETSSVQIRTMQSQPPPVYIIAPGRVYRRETADATHLPVFHQVEGLVVDEGITFADLKGTLDAVVKALFGQDRETKLGPAFFPFVEPGAELAVTCMRCDGAGCPVCGNGWIELLGCGMVHPQVLENCGYDPERYTGFAFGLGIDRVAILKYRIPDIRLLVEGDIRFLAQFGASP